MKFLNNGQAKMGMTLQELLLQENLLPLFTHLIQLDLLLLQWIILILKMLFTDQVRWILLGLIIISSCIKIFQKIFPGKKFISTESVSALQTRGHYDMPSDSIRHWPERWDKPFHEGNADLTCSAYENCSAPWGSTHEETLKELLKYNFASGMFIWTGFDYIGEPTPYPFPARSSYFGIVDMAGFPKDAYYLYQSLFTNKDVLHIFPHWNWKPGQTIDVWAYYNNADEVELFLNGKSLGTKKKTG